MAKYLDEARQVLRDEAHALQVLADDLGESFERTVDCLLGIRGRIAVTGMGKSGHVARKIAATLASTGSPAYFIHPAEASHGDLGMMTPDDAVIAISNSGNTAELRDIVLYASQNNMPIVAITRNADSFLGKHCDYLLLQPQLHEACPLDCAPTTSTTVQMALGDALAMCLLTARGFRREDFRRFHPGGSLGQKLSLVRDLMHTGDAMPLLTPDAPMMNVLAEMTRKGFGCVGVVDGEKLAREFCAAIDAKVCIAGSISSYARIDTMFDIGPWGFTMGSALFTKNFVPEGSFRDNLKAVADYMASK